MVACQVTAESSKNLQQATSIMWYMYIKYLREIYLHTEPREYLTLCFLKYGVNISSLFALSS